MLEGKSLLKYQNRLSHIRSMMDTSFKSKESEFQELLTWLGKANGKMLRALLVIISSEFGTPSENDINKLAAAVETLHLASLIHDDILDESALRRGLPTVHTSYGVKPAVFLGDYLFSTCYVLLSQLNSPYLLSAASKTIRKLCMGEIKQFYSIESVDKGIFNYFKRINGKTASLITFSLKSGAYISNVDRETSLILGRVGYLMGMSYQITDDIIDILSPTETAGKTTGNDLTQGIYNLPVLYELSSGNKELISLLKNRHTNNDAIIEIIRNSKGLEKSYAAASKYTNKALEIIDKLPDIAAKTSLHEIAEYLLIRNY